jgi:hypothetical protein
MRRSDLDDGSLVELVQGIAHSGGGLVLVQGHPGLSVFHFDVPLYKY